MYRALFAAFLLSACAEGATDDTDDTTCGDAAPEFEGALGLTDLGTLTLGGTERRAVQLSGTATDADGDLHTYTAYVWYDTLVDGEVAGDHDVSVTADVSETACGVSRTVAGAVLPLGDDVPFNAEVEFGLMIEDAAGHRSGGGEPILLTTVTPAE